MIFSVKLGATCFCNVLGNKRGSWRYLCLLVDPFQVFTHKRRSSSCAMADKISQLMFSLSSSSLQSPLKNRSPNVQLMESHGLIFGNNSAGYTVLPITVRSLNKLTSLVEEHMRKVGAHKVIMPSLIPLSLLKTSGRLSSTENEIFKFQDRKGRAMCLAPTHEEVVTSLLHCYHSLPYRYLPLRYYQITPKFRDEIRPSQGLLRAREFIMKDLYTFDVSEEKAQETYKQICSAYDALFCRIGVPVMKVKASVGNIGGKYSHEYHFVSESGEDRILVCERCNSGFNIEVEDATECHNCKGKLKELRSIEVGHTFLLGTKYSEAFDTAYVSQSGKKEHVQMGCYGLGMTRILASSIEVLSRNNNVRWPLSLAPYMVCILPPKKGSKESSSSLSGELEMALCSMPHLQGDILVDDRTNYTIGNRLKAIDSLGIPYIIVIGKKALGDDPKVELHDIYNAKEHVLSKEEVINYFENMKN